MSGTASPFERLKELAWTISDDERVILSGDQVAELEGLCDWAFRTIGRLEAQCKHKAGEEFQQGDRVVITRPKGRVMAGEISRIFEGGIGIPCRAGSSAIASWGQIIALLSPEDDW